MNRVIADFLTTYEHREVFTRREVVDLILDMVSAKEKNGSVQEERETDARVAEPVS